MTKLICEHRNRVGDIGELAFALHASQRDWIVSRPISEKRHYDYIVDNGRDRSRIQVKTTEILTDRNNYRVSLGHGGRSKVAYTKPRSTSSPSTSRQKTPGTSCPSRKRPGASIW